MTEIPILLQIKKAIELAYRDGITRIVDWQCDFQRITGRFLDHNELFSFTIAPDGISYDPIPNKDVRLDDLCTVGRACGEGCVSRTKGCKVSGFQVRSAAHQVIDNAATEITLKAHQIRIAEKLRNQRGLIVYHGLGSGKTLTAINAAEEYGGAVVVTPASLRENFTKELVKSKAKGHYDLYSYDEFRNNPPDLKGRMLIVDEAHRLRNSSTQTSQTISDSARDADKVLLLTGTPIQNKPHEIAPLVNIVAGAHVLPASESAFSDRYLQKKQVIPNWFDRTFKQTPVHSVVKPKNLKEFERQTSEYVDYYQPKQEGYPTVTKQTVDVEMDKGQVATYRMWTRGLSPATRRKMQDNLPLNKQEAGDLNVFINAQRQIANTPQGFDLKQASISPKFKEVISRVEASNGPALVYSNYLESGVDPLARELRQRNISHAVFTGQMSDKEKKQAVSDYNAGKLKVLIVSSSGGEGLDLKNTAQVHITEPHWNSEKIQQVIGRAIRYKSHEALPEDQRHVDVYEYLSVMPNRKEVTADQYLNTLSQKKKALNNQFLEVFQKNRRDEDSTPFVLQLKNAIELVYRDGITRILDWAQNGQAITGRFLDGAGLFSFTIDPEGISYNPEPIPRNDAYLVGYLARAQGMEALVTLDTLEYWTGYLVQGQRLDKASQCEKGRACGDGCVSKEKSCRVKTPIVKRVAIALLRRAHSEEFKASPVNLDRAVRLKEDEFRLKDYENAAAYNQQGELVLEKEGGAANVSFSNAEVSSMEGTILTHNHPAAMYFGDHFANEVDGGSFSGDDWHLAAVAEVAEIRAVGAEARYSLKPPKEGWNTDWWHDKAAAVYARNVQEVHIELVKEIQAGKITPARANIDASHRVAQRTAKELGVTYTREPIKVTSRDREVIVKNLPTARKRLQREQTKSSIAAIGGLIAFYLGVGALTLGIAAWAKGMNREPPPHLEKKPPTSER